MSDQNILVEFQQKTGSTAQTLAEAMNLLQAKGVGSGEQELASLGTQAQQIRRLRQRMQQLPQSAPTLQLTIPTAATQTYVQQPTPASAMPPWGGAPMMVRARKAPVWVKWGIGIFGLLFLALVAILLIPAPSVGDGNITTTDPAGQPPGVSVPATNTNGSTPRQSQQATGEEAEGPNLAKDILEEGEAVFNNLVFGADGSAAAARFNAEQGGLTAEQMTKQERCINFNDEPDCPRGNGRRGGVSGGTMSFSEQMQKGRDNSPEPLWANEEVFAVPPLDYQPEHPPVSPDEESPWYQPGLSANSMTLTEEVDPATQEFLDNCAAHIDPETGFSIFSANCPQNAGATGR